MYVDLIDRHLAVRQEVSLCLCCLESEKLNSRDLYLLQYVEKNSNEMFLLIRSLKNN